MRKVCKQHTTGPAVNEYASGVGRDVGQHIALKIIIRDFAMDEKTRYRLYDLLQVLAIDAKKAGIDYLACVEVRSIMKKMYPSIVDRKILTGGTRKTSTNEEMTKCHSCIHQLTDCQMAKLKKPCKYVPR